MEKKQFNIDHLKRRKDELFKIIKGSMITKPPPIVGTELSSVKASINRFNEINRQIATLKLNKEKLISAKKFTGKN